MIRRKFIQGIACGLGTVNAGAAVPTRTVKYNIEGFTCVTCAVGLDSLLADQRGIVKSKSCYPDRTCVIEYNATLVTEAEIKGYIQELGFKARGSTV
jgi:Cu+-exporting ATPase